jgi:hypothetical protein
VTVTADRLPARALVAEHDRLRAGAPHSENWLRAEHFLAFAGTVIIAMRLQLTPQLLTVGDLLTVATLPLWFPATRRYVGARLMLFLGFLTVPSGLLLSWLNSDDHQVLIGEIVTATVVIVSLMFSVGFMLWAREKMSEGGLVAAFGLGLLLGVSTDSPLYASNPWKFGFALPITILALGLMQMVGRRELELLVVIILCVVSGLTDARSSFAILLLAAALLAWQMRPEVSTRRASALRAVVGLAIGAVVIYNLGQALFLEGVLGEVTQERTARQISESGSLILGGRPEITATLALMYNHPLGFGSGTIPNYNDITIAKGGMAKINYDPNNGYVENWMFGHGYALHSMFGDLWAKYGLVGLALAGFIFFVVLRRLGQTLTTKTASAVLIYASALTLWNVFFAPVYSGLKMLILVFALGMMRKAVLPAEPLMRPRRAVLRD